MSIVTKFVLWSLLFLALVGLTGVKAIWNNQNASTHDFVYWKTMYRQIASSVTTDPETKKAALDTSLDVEQYTIQQFEFYMPDGTSQQRVDRCESCHIGVDNPGMTAENIIKAVDKVTVTAAQVPDYLNTHPRMRDVVYTLGAHPGKANAVTQGSLAWAVSTNSPGTAADVDSQKLYALEASKHAFATYGCTTCHYGSGRDMIQEKAHGDTEFWMRPLMPAKYMDAACAQCHATSNPKFFTTAYLPQMTTIERGQLLFKRNACWGCHKIEGFSRGNVGPELSYEGRLATYHTIERQIWDPRYKVNNCVMPYFFSKRIVNGQGGVPMIQDPSGKLLALSSVKRADVSDEIGGGLNDRGYIPDAASQPDVDALVTFVVAQTGLNYSQSPTTRIQRLSAYNAASPLTTPVTVDEGKLLFEQSGCYACHFVGDPNNPTLGKGGYAGPNLSMEGARHSQQWLIAHYLDPQAFVPKSVMPVFPFSDSQRAALSLYDLTFIPKGGHPVSPDQDMPTAAMQKDNIVDPQVRYMTR